MFARRTLFPGLAAGVLGVSMLLAGCGTPHPAAAPRSSPQAARHHPAHKSPPIHAQSALNVPSGLLAPFHAALQALQAPSPAWSGAVAPPNTTVELNGVLWTTGPTLTAAWHTWQTFPHHQSRIHLALSQALVTGTNGAASLPVVGMPAGQPNLATTTPNVAVATGVVTAGAAAHPFSAIFARRAAGWVLVSWRWL